MSNATPTTSPLVKVTPASVDDKHLLLASLPKLLDSTCQGRSFVREEVVREEVVREEVARRLPGKSREE